MNDHFDTDYLEAYLLDRLSKNDRITLEQLIEKDPILKSELQIQQEVIEAIRSQRKIQLKQRLSEIQIVSTSTENFYRAMLLGTALIAGLFSIYWFTKGLDTQLAKEQLRQEEKLIAQSSQGNASTKDSPTLEILDEQSELTIEPEPRLPLQEETVLENEATITTPITTEQVANPAPELSNEAAVQEENLVSLSTEDKLEDEADHLAINKEEEDQKKMEILQPTSKDLLSFRTKKPEDEVKGIFDGPNEARLEDLAAKNRLSYQYYNNQLFLYNNRSWGRELRMEIEGKEQLFLYYESKYYQLNENQVERKEPCPITDPEMIKKLDDIRLQLYGR